MKNNLFLLLSVIAMVLSSCKKDEVEPTPTTPEPTNNTTYSQVVHRFKFYKENPFENFCGASGEMNGDFIFAIDADEVTSGADFTFASFIDSMRYADKNNSNKVKSFSYSKLIGGKFLNQIKLRNVSNAHDFSYFKSLTDTLKFDINITGTTGYYDPIFRYKYYPKGTNNCPATSGSITHGGIKISDVGKAGNDEKYFIQNDTMYIVTKYGL